MGVQVNAITRSGTNTMLGTVSGFFRDDKFNAADHVASAVLPYQNQQLALTFGGRSAKIVFISSGITSTSASRTRAFTTLLFRRSTRR